MRGHIHKRGSTWTVVYDETAGEEGKRRQRSKGGFATKRDAQRFLTTRWRASATAPMPHRRSSPSASS
jgi:hypothetical protein